MPSGSITRRLSITLSTSGMEELSQQILRYPQAILGRGTDVINRSDFSSKCRRDVAALSNSGFDPPASQWNRRDTAERNANFAGRFVFQAGEANLGNGLR